MQEVFKPDRMVLQQNYAFHEEINSLQVIYHMYVLFCKYFKNFILSVDTENSGRKFH